MSRLFVALVAMLSQVAIAAPPIPVSVKLPPGISVIRVEIRDPQKRLVATCTSNEACERLTASFSTPGRYSLVLDYRALDGMAESYSIDLSAGFGESSFSIDSIPEANGLVSLSPHAAAPPIAGVALRVTAPGTVGTLPTLELVNGSATPIAVYAQGDHALISIEPLGATPPPPLYGGCGTGVGVAEVAPGKTLPTMRIASIGRVPPLFRGRYRVSVHYGLDALQELTTGGTRRVSIDVEVDGPEPSTQPTAPASTLARALGGEVIVERDPGRPAIDFAPAASAGATTVKGAPLLALDSIVSGTLTATASRRYFRVRIPRDKNHAGDWFYVRCKKAPCSGSAYAVLNERIAVDSVSDAKSLRESGGWTKLTDDQWTMPRDRTFILVVGCLDGCKTPIHFSGHVYAWSADDPR